MLEVNHLVGFGAGGGDVQYIGAAYRDGDGSITYPAGTKDGDLVVLCGVDTSNVMGAPSGFTQQATFSWSLNYKAKVFTKVVAGEASVSVTVGVGVAELSVYRNAQVGTVGSFVESGYSDNSIVLAGITPQDAASSFIVGMVLDRDPGAPTKPAAFNSSVAAAGTYFGMSMAYALAQSVSGNQTWMQATTNPYSAVGVLMEVKPK